MLEASGKESLVLSADDNVEEVGKAVRGLDVTKEGHPVLDARRVVHLSIQNWNFESWFHWQSGR